MAELPSNPKYPERIYWGCEKLCPANDLRCREERAEHPCEAFGGGTPDQAPESAGTQTEPLP